MRDSKSSSLSVEEVLDDIGHSTTKANVVSVVLVEVVVVKVVIAIVPLHPQVPTVEKTQEEEALKPNQYQKKELIFHKLKVADGRPVMMRRRKKNK